VGSLSFPVDFLLPETEVAQMLGDALSKFIIFLFFLFIFWKFDWLKGSGLTRFGKNQTWFVILTALYLGSCNPVKDTTLPEPTHEVQISIQESDESSEVSADLFNLHLTFSAHQGRVLDLAFSSDGEYLATSGQDLAIKLWDPISGEALHSFPMGIVDMADIDISQQGNLLASGEAVWDLESKQEILTLERGSVIPAFVAFSPNGGTLALAPMDQETRLWDLPSGELKYSFPEMEETRSKRMEFSPDGSLLGEGVMDGSIRIWHVEEGELALTLHYSGETDIHDIEFSPDGKYLAYVGRLPWVIVWDLSSGEVVQRFRTLDNMNGVAFSADSRILAASAGAEKAVLLWDMESSKSLGSLPLASQSMALGFSPDGRWLAAGTFDGEIFLWSISMDE
jgi:WD40 repeat protein